MDSLSQIGLGAAVAVAVMGRRTSVWKAAAWGAVAGTLPDLDVLIDHGDPIRDMVLHRAESHALFWLSAVSLPFGAAVARLVREPAAWRRWWLASWLALITHPLLDAMTVYGTQLGLPFTNHPLGVGSIFIIDPLYTLPLLVGTGWALARRGRGRALAANSAGLLLSTAYLAWSAAAQQHVEKVARASLAAQGVAVERLLVTPTAFNTVLWRIVAVSGATYHEGFHSLLDRSPQLAFDRFDRGTRLEPGVAGVEGVRRIAAFSKGFYKLSEDGGRVLISDLRMGQEPTYTFTFVIAEGRPVPVPLAKPQSLSSRPDLSTALPWLWRRLGGEAIPPPRAIERPSGSLR